MTETPEQRRLRMGLETLQGPRAQGFFTPYRYAHQVAEPLGYPELEPLFRAAEPAMARVLDRIDGAAEVLAALDGPPPLPRWHQSWFPRLDGAACWALVSEARPRKVIEVGSGHSTRMLACAAPEAAMTCIDPQPRADISRLGVDLLGRVLSPEDIPRFAALKPGDVAFFDSSHVLWPGSDVDMILNRVLPVLNPGVLVHIHDVLLPDPYPAHWAWRGYTEHNALSGWLCGRTDILWASHHARTRMAAAERPGVAGLPLPEGALETSLWLRMT